MLCRQCELPLATSRKECPRCGMPVRKPGIWNQILDKLMDWFSNHASVRVVKNGKLLFTSPTGERKVYTSLEELPPEVREVVETRIPGAMLTSEVQTFNSLNEAPPEIRAKFEEAVQGHGNRVEIVCRNSGQRQVYNSLEEVPPDVRARIEQARQEAGFENEDNGKIPMNIGSANTSFTIRHDR